MSSARHRPWLVPAVFAVATLAALAPLAGAAPLGAQGGDLRPARIHEGTCDDLGRVAFDLGDVGAAFTVDGTQVPVPERVGPETALPVAVGVTTIDVSLTDLVNDPHALVVASSEEEPETIVACGDVGGPQVRQMAGMTMPGDELIVGLAGAEGTGAAAIAVLRADGRDVTVTIYLAEGSVGEDAPSEERGLGGTPEQATPVADTTDRSARWAFVASRVMVEPKPTTSLGRFTL